MYEVKSYHPGRYKMHNPEFRGKIENALQLQLLFYQSGGACPEPLTLEERCMHILPCGRYMTAMTCCPGTMSPAGMIGEHKMHSLGRAAADMHAAWDSAATLGLGVVVPSEEPLWRSVQPHRTEALVFLQRANYSFYRNSKTS